MQVPMLAITNTHPDFAWLPQALESLMSAELWHPMIAATVGHTYRQIVDHFYARTCDDDIPRSRALGSFDFRAEEFAAIMQSQLDTEVHPECDYGLYCTLCDALSDITLWQHKDIWWGDRDQFLHDLNNEKGSSPNDQTA